MMLISLLYSCYLVVHILYSFTIVFNGQGRKVGEEGEGS